MEDESEQRVVEVSDLVALCRLLNQAGVRYMVYGGLSCILHGHSRTTDDVDVWVGEDIENIRKALDALSRWGQGFAAELTPEDVLTNVVVRIGDALTLDLAARVWKLDWDEAWRNRRIVEVAGERIPILGRKDLIQSKKTYRESDAYDVGILSRLSGPEPGRPAQPESG